MMGEDLDPDAQGFAGWHCPTPHRPWRKLVEGASEAECRDLLVGAAEGGEFAVLPAGVHPQDSKKS